MTCARRDVFLLIEPVADYSPLAPVLCARRYGRDCQFNEGHELGRIPAEEILQTRVGALVYREYLDPEYTTPNPAALVPADVTELPWSRRVQGGDLGPAGRAALSPCAQWRPRGVPQPARARPAVRHRLRLTGVLALPRVRVSQGLYPTGGW